MDLFRKLLYPIHTAVCLTITILGALTISGVLNLQDYVQASTVLLAAMTSAMGIWLLPVIQRIF